VRRSNCASVPSAEHPPDINGYVRVCALRACADQHDHRHPEWARGQLPHRAEGKHDHGVGAGVRRLCCVKMPTVTLALALALTLTLKLTLTLILNLTFTRTLVRSTSRRRQPRTRVRNAQGSGARIQVQPANECQGAPKRKVRARACARGGRQRPPLLVPMYYNVSVIYFVYPLVFSLSKNSSPAGWCPERYSIKVDHRSFFGKIVFESVGSLT
jgi:hypothetical protein